MPPARARCSTVATATRSTACSQKRRMDAPSPRPDSPTISSSARPWMPIPLSRSTKTARSRSSARTGSGKTPQPAPAAPPAMPPRPPSPLRRELVGIALLLLAVFVAGALAMPADATGSCWDAGGRFGPIGSCIRRWSLAAIGGPAAALLPLIAAIHALRLFGRMHASTDRSWVVFLGGAALIAPVAIALARVGLDLTVLAPADTDPWSGVWGSFAAYYLTKGFGTAGAWIVTALAASGLMAATLSWNPIRMIVGRSEAHV